MESSRATGHRLSIPEELEEIENLPGLPVVVTHIQRLVSGSRSGMAEIARAMSRDQAIAARVIRLVNSAFYGLRSRVTSIQHAIVVLGLNTVKNLVTGVSIVRAFEDGGGTSMFDRERFWLHTFSCALLSKRIAADLRRPQPEDYFLAGLLHDTGILVLDQFFHDRFVETIQYCAANKTGYLHAERAVLGTTHEQVGEYLARKWQLPEVLAPAARYHHKPPCSDPELAGSSLDLLRVVHLADVCTINNGYYLGLSDEQRTYDSTALHRSALAPDRIQKLFEDVEKEVTDLIKEWGAQE